MQFFNHLRAILLITQQITQMQQQHAAIGFLRLRVGNLHKADGGMLLLHLRDLLSDEQNGAQMIEKLHRFLRNGTLQIEDASSGAQSANYVVNNTLLPLLSSWY